MNCRVCDMPITHSLVPALPLCEACVSDAVDALCDDDWQPDEAPRYDPLRDVLTEADILE